MHFLKVKVQIYPHRDVKFVMVKLIIFSSQSSSVIILLSDPDKVRCTTVRINTSRKRGNTVTDYFTYLEEEHISPGVLNGIRDYRKQFLPDETAAVPPRYFYYGKEVWEQAAHALLAGENLLLAGAKATGKNVLAENLAAVFGRPVWNVSLHINTDASSLLGTDTFQNGEVVFRPGPVCQCASAGGFCILDEINMARNEALAVLHSLLDFRKSIQIPGYGPIKIHEASRFIATMNYGYAGTREVNEALSSRFMVLQMPEIESENLEKLLEKEFPSLRKEYRKQFTALFLDIRSKCRSGELTEKVLDLRGLIGALRMIEGGLELYPALHMGITGKTPDPYEQSLVRDIISSRFSAKTDPGKLFDL